MYQKNQFICILISHRFDQRTLYEKFDLEIDTHRFEPKLHICLAEKLNRFVTLYLHIIGEKHMLQNHCGYIISIFISI